jgi:hypothetical protein
VVCHPKVRTYKKVENKVKMKTFGLKRQKVTGIRRKLYNEELYNCILLEMLLK